MSPKTPSSSISGSIPIAPAENNDQKRQEKYPKIQPALAIKPKPVPIAVLPKPSNQPISTFDPNSRTTSLKNDISLNINTSKKWVLPPRPRPGRKPTEECPKRKKTQGGAPSSQASPVCQNTSITNQTQTRVPCQVEGAATHTKLYGSHHQADKRAQFCSEWSDHFRCIERRFADQFPVWRNQTSTRTIGKN